VALGLNYLHSQRPPMMHRDLKSPNVLLSEEGVAKIADVGMVRARCLRSCAALQLADCRRSSAAAAAWARRAAASVVLEV
jgi:serine/threonine protein kinase